MKRRTFIERSAAVGTGLGLGGLTLNSCSRFGDRKITILHTNDVHSHIDPFPDSHARFPGLGGVARRATLIKAIREQNPNTLLLDAGDIFQGTPYFNYYGGELEFRLMNKMGYQAATLGNHDFDNGLNGLLAQLPNAEFKFVNANYDFSNTVLEGFFKPYEIYEMDGIKVGVFGLGIQLLGLVDPTLFKETKYLDPVDIALDIARELREEKGCNLVICLSHLGYRYQEEDLISDVRLAQLTEGIDLIIGGHTHTFLEEANLLLNRAGKKVLVNQVGCYGVRLGRVDFTFDNRSKDPTSSSTAITV